MIRTFPPRALATAFRDSSGSWSAFAARSEIIGELARQLPAAGEIELTTDVDRILELSRTSQAASPRPSVAAARRGAERAEVVAALALEIDALQQADRRRLTVYEAAAEAYLAEFRSARTAKPAGWLRRCSLRSP